MYNETEPYQLFTLILPLPYRRADYELFPALSFSKEYQLFPVEKKQLKQLKQLV